MCVCGHVLFVQVRFPYQPTLPHCTNTRTPLKTHTPTKIPAATGNAHTHAHAHTHKHTRTPSHIHTHTHTHRAHYASPGHCPFLWLRGTQHRHQPACAQHKICETHVGGYVVHKHTGMHVDIGVIGKKPHAWMRDACKHTQHSTGYTYRAHAVTTTAVTTDTHTRTHQQQQQQQQCANGRENRGEGDHYPPSWRSRSGALR